jgi:hypothetical protein
MGGLHGHMVHTPADIILLALVVLWCLVVASGLLLLWSLTLSTIVELAWSVLRISLGATVGVVTSLTAPEACVTTCGNRSVVSHGCPSGGVLAVLRKIGALH